MAPVQRLLAGELSTLWPLAAIWGLGDQAGEGGLASSQRKVLESLPPPPTLGGVRGSKYTDPALRVLEMGFASVQVCSSLSAFLSPDAGLCVLLKWSRCACGGWCKCALAGDLPLPSLTLSSPTAINPLPLQWTSPCQQSCPGALKACSPGEGNVGSGGHLERAEGGP